MWTLVRRLILIAATLQMLSDSCKAQHVSNENSSPSLPRHDRNQRKHQDFIGEKVRKVAAPTAPSLASFNMQAIAQQANQHASGEEASEMRALNDARFFEIEMTIKSFLLPDIFMLFGIPMGGQNHHSHDDSPSLIEQIVGFLVRRLMRM